jgi:hypothetical protein
VSTTAFYFMHCEAPRGKNCDEYIKKEDFKEGSSRRWEALPVLDALLPPFSPATKSDIKQ